MAVVCPSASVVVEATTNCWAVVRALEPYVARIVVSNPLITKAIAKAKVKTDKVDARVLSHLLRLGYLPEVWQPDASTSQLREWTARRGRIVSQCTAVINRIRGTLAQRLLDCPHQIRTAKARQWIANDPEMRNALEGEIAKLSKTLFDDLKIAVQRSQSVRAERAATNVRETVNAWKTTRDRLLDGTKLDVSWELLDNYAAKVDEQIDLLINYTAGDGFIYRQTARATVAGRRCRLSGSPMAR